MCVMHGRGCPPPQNFPGGRHAWAGGGSVASMDNSDAVRILSTESAMHTMHSVLHCRH